MRRFLFALIALVVILGLILSECAPASAPESTQGPKTIRVGALDSLTGMFAGFGQGASFGAKAAVEDINKQGGVYVKEFGRKIPLELISYDPGSDPERAGLLAQQLITADKVDFLVSGNEPPNTMYKPAAVSTSFNKVYLAHAAVYEAWEALAKDASPAWKNTWAFGFAIAQGPPEGDFRYKKPGFVMFDLWLTMLGKIADKTNKKAGMFVWDDPDGRAWYQFFAEQFKNMGFQASGVERNLGLFPPETTDFSSMIAQWKSDQCDIIVANCAAPQYGAMAKQARGMGLKPKALFVTKAACNYIDVSSWGGDIPLGIALEIKWSPAFNTKGIGDTTPQSLLERWTKETGQPLNDNIGLGYYVIQVLADAIERAGALDTDSVNKALADTDMMTINGRVKFTQDRWNYIPLSFGQWFKTDRPEKWELKIVHSDHEFLKPQADLLFPIPYE
jgi:branched-chain amino acid transport system substrate-binding protein